jgi:nitroimidazol reductase NimA-like FMN-containing flavoprotein (pyridoxamine 5'-phosphate oxidase superfamily)
VRVPSTRITRLRDLQVEDRSALDSLIDGTLVGHVGLVVDDGPVVVPTAVARENDSLLVHGSTGSRWMRALARGTPACVAVTALDGVIVARSTFESSMRYRSAVLYGRFDRLGGARKERALGVIVDKLIPGRAAEVRPSTAAELNRTMVLSMPITTWSLKVSDGWPEDSQPDVEGPAWAGVVPLTLRALPPQPAPDLRSGIPVPPSVAALGRTRDA